MRQLTAEMKRELTIEDRMKLAELYGEIGLVREQLEECGRVLVGASSAELTQRALDVLFSRELCSPLGLDELRGRLVPGLSRLVSRMPSAPAGPHPWRHRAQGLDMTECLVGP